MCIFKLHMYGKMLIYCRFLEMVIRAGFDMRDVFHCGITSKGNSVQLIVYS